MSLIYHIATRADWERALRDGEYTTSTIIGYEDVRGAAAPFPHIYGPLSADAVIATRPLSAGPDGAFSFAAEH